MRAGRPTPGRRRAAWAAGLASVLLAAAGCGASESAVPPTAQPSTAGTAASSAAGSDPATASAGGSTGAGAAESPAASSGATESAAPASAASATTGGAGVSGYPVAAASLTVPGCDGVLFVTPSMDAACTIGRVQDPDAVRSGTGSVDRLTAACRLVNAPAIRAEDAQTCPGVANTPGVIWADSESHGYGDCRGDVPLLTAWAMSTHPDPSIDELVPYDEAGTLAYGASVTLGEWTCLDAVTGVTCASTSGAGFTISSTGYSFR